MLLVSKKELEHSKEILGKYKKGGIVDMSPELWRAKKVVDSTIHPDTGEAVLLPFRMSAFVLTNLVVTAGMLTPGLGVRFIHYKEQRHWLISYLQTTGTLLWQIANQSLNVAINHANANKSEPLSTSQIATSYFLAVGAASSVALGLNAVVPRLKNVKPSTRVLLGRLVPFAAVASAGVLNVFLMRGEEIRRGIDVFPVLSEEEKEKGKKEESLGKSKKAATIAVGETAASRILNSSPIMVFPALALLRLQKTQWLRRSPRLVLPVNLSLILGTSLAVLPFALGVFPQREMVHESKLEPEFQGKGGKDGMVIFNRGI